jgi:predicted dienelactone hydrolase
LIAALVLTMRQAEGAVAPLTAVSSLYKADPGPWTVTVRDEDWMDIKRNRAVPVRIYLPSKLDDRTPRPVIIFSHGWGGSRTSYSYFTQHLASWGYLVIAPTHVGSDSASIAFGRQTITLPGGLKRETLMQSVQDPANLRNRPQDISFVIDQLSRQGDLASAADLTRIGVAGHSFGAYTAMVIGGMLVDSPDGKKRSLRDPRVKAVLPMSPEGSGLMGITLGAWDQFAVPVLFMTGTHDYGLGLRAQTWRDEPFKSIHTVPTWLVTIVGGNHLTFARPAGHAPLIQSVSVAFFDAQLLRDSKATSWINEFFLSKHAECNVDRKE